MAAKSREHAKRGDGGGAQSTHADTEANTEQTDEENFKKEFD